MSEQVELLVFKLGENEYVVDPSKVQEIRSFEGVTKFPDCPSFVLGVINLRGVIIPVIDLRIKFVTPEPNYDQFLTVIILQAKTRQMGLVVDSVSDVISALGPIGPREVVGASGTYSIEGRTLHLLDIDALDES
jgi:purine-binding chemotaxis protein CheW